MQYPKILSILVIFFNLFSSFAATQVTVSEKLVSLYDPDRDRVIPVALYYCGKNCSGQSVVILNHGYGQNQGGDYRLYSHIAKTLAKHGYFVISIQHELETDELLAMEGNLYLNRLPNWKQGTNNILFAIKTFKKIKPELNWMETIAIGHSNGGDTVMLFAEKYPEHLSKAISLDNRRMPIPRISKPKLSSIRGSDYSADAGVIPSLEEQQEFNIDIIYFSDIKHTEMDDKASAQQSKKINACLLYLLKKT